MWDGLREAAARQCASALEFWLPRACAGCRAAIGVRERAVPATDAFDQVLCRECAGTLRRLPLLACARCQEPVSANRQLCSACEETRSPLASCTAAVRFEGNAERWIHAYKYPRPGIGGLSGGPEAIACALIAQAGAQAAAASSDVVIPVPLHPARLRARGFNPASTLARHLARRFGARFDTRALMRVRNTPSQTRLDRAARRRNMRDAFACRAISARRVWLVDDVVTTGSTLEEAARSLRRAGVREIHAICAARTPLPNA